MLFSRTANPRSRLSIVARPTAITLSRHDRSGEDAGRTLEFPTLITRPSRNGFLGFTNLPTSVGVGQLASSLTSTSARNGRSFVTRLKIPMYSPFAAVHAQTR